MLCEAANHRSSSDSDRVPACAVAAPLITSMTLAGLIAAYRSAVVPALPLMTGQQRSGLCTTGCPPVVDARSAVGKYPWPRTPDRFPFTRFRSKILSGAARSSRSAMRTCDRCAAAWARDSGAGISIRPTSQRFSSMTGTGSALGS